MRPGPDDMATRLAVVVGRLARRIRPRMGELSMGHFSTLGSIERTASCRPSDLAALERVSPPTMARILATLESRALIVRQQSRDDARSVTIELTRAGSAIVSRTRRERAQALGELLSGLDTEQLAHLTAAMDALEHVAQLAAAADA